MHNNELPDSHLQAWADDLTGPQTDAGLTEDAPHVVIVGGGFGGLFAARALGGSGYRVTLLDKRNFQLFQPLLYQVATGQLTVGDISAQQRVMLRKHKNVRTLLGTVYDIDPAHRRLHFEGGTIVYDYLIAATGVKYQYFGNDHWRHHAPGLKTVEHALEMRHRIFQAFEDAERMPPGPMRDRKLSFVVIGAGPTGVELAGALGELSQRIMRGDFRNICSSDARIILIEGAPDVLPVYPEPLRKRAAQMLRDLKIELRTGTLVETIEQGQVTLLTKDAQGQEQREIVHADTLLWAAGVKPSAFGRQLAERTKAETDRAGRMKVRSHLSLLNYPEIFVIGDLAHAVDKNGHALPGLAPVALQQGQYVAKMLKRKLKGKTTKPFRYFDKGSMAIIGRHKVVGQVFGMQVHGFMAWLAWSVIHVASLVEPSRRVTVAIQWMWRITGRNSDRLITGKPPNTESIQRQHGLLDADAPLKKAS